MSVSRRASPKAQKQIAELNAAKKGRPLTVACREQLAKLHASPEFQKHIAKLNASKKGIPLSLEQRQKISAANKGKMRSAENRANMKKAWIKRKENKQGIV
jgi:hypothetical protein